MIIHGPKAKWVAITEVDILRPEFEIGVDPEVAENDVHFIHDLADMFNASIGGTIHTTLNALNQRWGGSKGDVIKNLLHIGATTAVNTSIRWSDQAVRIVRLFIGPTWGVFGSQPHADA